MDLKDEMLLEFVMTSKVPAMSRRRQVALGGNICLDRSEAPNKSDLKRCEKVHDRPRRGFSSNGKVDKSLKGLWLHFERAFRRMAKNPPVS